MPDAEASLPDEELPSRFRSACLCWEVNLERSSSLQYCCICFTTCSSESSTRSGNMKAARTQTNKWKY